MKHKQEDKMVSPAQNNIANELYQTISNAKFTQVLCLLNPEFALTINHFKRIKDITHNSYWIDTQKCITKSGNPIASGVFDIFGRFESRLACEARDKMVEWAPEHKEELGETAQIALRQLDIGVMYWINKMQKETTLADELALYCLRKVYNRHIKVYTSSYCWTTLRDQFTLSQATKWQTSKYLGIAFCESLSKNPETIITKYPFS